MSSPLWSYKLPGPAGGIAFARESGHVLAWDATNRLSVLSARGSVQAHAAQPRAVATAAIADDGSGLAVADDESVAWLRCDLSMRWRKNLSTKPTALAMDSLGRCVAVADVGSRLQLFDKAGRAVGTPLKTPRPLYHLHFLAAEPLLIAAADFGLVLALDLRSRQWTWQDSPVIHLGGLSASDDGKAIALACFSEGIRRYDLSGKPMPTLPTPEPCRHLSTSFDGRRFLVGSIFSGLYALDDSGASRYEQRFEQPVAGVRLAPLGDAGIVALSDGRVIGLDLSAELK
jgi:hypothetical protein